MLTRAGAAGSLVLLLEDQALQLLRTPPAMLDWPVHGRVAGIGEGLLPSLVPRDFNLTVQGWERTGVVVRQPCAELPTPGR